MTRAIRQAAPRGDIVRYIEREMGLSAAINGAIIKGIGAMVAGAGLCAAILWLSGVEGIAPDAALAVKLAYGAALGAFITRTSLAHYLLGQSR